MKIKIIFLLIFVFNIKAAVKTPKAVNGVIDFSNYKLFLAQQGKVKTIFSSGVTGLSKKKSIPQLLKGESSFTAEGGETERRIFKVIKETFERSLELQNITYLEAFCNGPKEQLPNTELKNVIAWIDQLSLEAEEFDIEKINKHLKEAIKEIDYYVEQNSLE